MESLSKAPQPQPHSKKCKTCLPDKNEIKNALGSFAGEKLSLKKVFASLDMYNPIDPPKKGEWLWENLEEPQSFDQYAGGKNVRLVPNKKEIIYVQPIKCQNTYLSKRLINDMTKFIKAFFYGCKVVKLED